MKMIDGAPLIWLHPLPLYGMQQHARLRQDRRRSRYRIDYGNGQVTEFSPADGWIPSRGGIAWMLWT